MAGLKGRSGGARKGAGRKPRQHAPLPAVTPDPPSIGAVAKSDDPKAFLLGVMNNAETDARLRIDAAKALMPFTHQKKGEGGKKEEKQAAAGKAVAGKFAPAAPPRLVVNNK